MFRLLLGTSVARPFFSTSFFFLPSKTCRLKCKRNYKCSQMGIGEINSESIRKARFRLCNVSGCMTELLEIEAPNPTLHVLFIPGNPGIVTFYNDFLESLYELFGGNASVTAIGHISHSSKDWERGRLFSLQEQIDHKIDFIAHELKNSNTPVILVGHSIGSHISMEIFKRVSRKVIYCIGLYPFLALNKKSSKQTLIKKLAESNLLSSLVSSIVAMLGLIPSWSKFIVKKTLGNSWSATAVDAACSHLVKYHMMRNMLFMAKTEFQTFSEAPDWEFLRAKQRQLAFLFGTDDHWGPLSLFEEISKQTPDIHVSIENEGHDHAFSCSKAGSIWVAQHVASLIKKHTAGHVVRLGCDLNWSLTPGCDSKFAIDLMPTYTCRFYNTPALILFFFKPHPIILIKPLSLSTMSSSSTRRKLALNTVSVNLGCSCRRPRLFSSIFNPKPKPKSPTYQHHAHHNHHRSASSTSWDKTGNSTSLSPSDCRTTSTSSSSASTVDGFGRVKPKSVAIEKDSDDPYLDFRQSMLQMIVENQIYSKDDLKELLNCFLQLNSPSLHGVIIRVFTEIWNGFFFASRPSNQPSPRPYVQPKFYEI